MRKLTIATSIALTGAALAMPAGATADTAADSVACGPPKACIEGWRQTVEHLITCPGSPACDPVGTACRLIFGPSCSF